MTNPETSLATISHATAVARLKARTDALRQHAAAAAHPPLRALLRSTAFLIDRLSQGDQQSRPSLPSDVDLLPMAYLRGPDRKSPAKGPTQHREPDMLVWLLNPGHAPEIPDGWELHSALRNDGMTIQAHLINCWGKSEAMQKAGAQIEQYSLRCKATAEQPAQADFDAALEPAAPDARFKRLEQTIAEQNTLIQALNARINRLPIAAEARLRQLESVVAEGVQASRRADSRLRKIEDMLSPPSLQAQAKHESQ